VKDLLQNRAFLSRGRCSRNWNRLSMPHRRRQNPCGKN